MEYFNQQQFAQQLDTEDVLKNFRSQFHIPAHKGQEQIYFCGNSLGLQPKNTSVYLDQELEKWRNLAVEGWFTGDDNWINYLQYLKTPLSKIVGAKPSEVTVMNNLTVNLHLMLTTFYQPTATRFKILTEAGAFPSDQYALETHLKTRGINPETAIIEVTTRENEHIFYTEDILQLIHENQDSLAMVMLGGINYYNGQVLDMSLITQTAQAYGIIVGFDLAHCVGNIPLELHNWQVDFAVWCSYKYLNSGMGGVSGVFIHEKHHVSNLPRLAGWWGYDQATRFKMEKGFVPMQGADGWQLSTPTILAMACHRAALEITDAAGINALRAKSIKLTGFLRFIIEKFNEQNNHILRIITPVDTQQNGCQISILAEKNGKELFNRLVENQIIGDWREPNVIRLSPVPLYNTFTEVYKVGVALGVS
ncbi:kynureninase [Flectobacillus longus]|uniref:kynureninase n=1 Tax=Flectobacillus longus TaxID=2984207 RepID=UPI0024B84C25|nr:kynureninase [Flectobacillus longus]MDI9878450.1 kynureninase [Flectobacillus longus]